MTTDDTRAAGPVDMNAGDVFPERGRMPTTTPADACMAAVVHVILAAGMAGDDGDVHAAAAFDAALYALNAAAAFPEHALHAWAADAWDAAECRGMPAGDDNAHVAAWAWYALGVAECIVRGACPCFACDTARMHGDATPAHDVPPWPPDDGDDT